MKRLTILLVLAALLFTSSCALRSVDGDKGNETENDVTTEEKIEFYKTDVETYSIVTPYCNLYYPTRWQDKVKTEAATGEGSYTVSFYALLEEQTVPLYAISIGEKDGGALLGTLDTKEGAKDVRLYDKFSEYEGGLSATSEAEFYEMCEDVNVIISKLVYESKMKLHN